MNDTELSNLEYLRQEVDAAVKAMRHDTLSPNDIDYITMMCQALAALELREMVEQSRARNTVSWRHTGAQSGYVRADPITYSDSDNPYTPDYETFYAADAARALREFGEAATDAASTIRTDTSRPLYADFRRHPDGAVNVNTGYTDTDTNTATSETGLTEGVINPQHFSTGAWAISSTPNEEANQPHSSEIERARTALSDSISEALERLPILGGDHGGGYLVTDVSVQSDHDGEILDVTLRSTYPPPAFPTPDFSFTQEYREELVDSESWGAQLDGEWVDEDGENED